MGEEQAPDFEQLDDTMLLMLWSRAQVTVMLYRVVVRRPPPEAMLTFCRQLSREITARNLDQRSTL